MDTFLISEMLSSLASGDLPKFMAYTGIFFVIWLEVRGLKKQLKIMNTTISDSFASGEKRFESIETHVTNIDLRLAKVETKGV